MLEHLDGVEIRVGSDSDDADLVVAGRDDAGAMRAMAVLIVLAGVAGDEGRASRHREVRMPAVDAGVDDADLDATAGRS